MIYAIVCTDVDNSLERRKRARPAHLERLDALQDQGRLILAGPNPAVDSNDPGEAGFTGSVIVAEFASLEDALAEGSSARRSFVIRNHDRSVGAASYSAIAIAMLSYSVSTLPRSTSPSGTG